MWAASDQCFGLEVSKEEPSCRPGHPALAVSAVLRAVSPVIPDVSCLSLRGVVILSRALDHFLVCGSAFGQILENTGGPLHLWVHVKIFVAPWANPQPLPK